MNFQGRMHVAFGRLRTGINHYQTLTKWLFNVGQESKRLLADVSSSLNAVSASESE